MKKGTYKDVESGGNEEPLTPEMSAYLRKCIINSVLNDSGSPGEEGEEGLGPPAAKGSRNKTVPTSTGKAETPWWQKALKGLRGKGKAIYDNVYKSKKASARSVADRWGRF